jgi:hypothetical protein
MTTTALDFPGTTVRPRAWTRFLPPFGGLALVGGLIALFLTPAGEDSGETAAEVVRYATDKEGWLVATALFGLASLLLSGGFVSGLHARLRAVLTPAESTLVLVGGVVFALCFMLSWVVWTATLVDLPSDPARALAQAETYLAIDDIGWFLLGASGVGAALMAVPASLAAVRAGLPAWLGWIGVALGIASLATVTFVGIFAWMAWIAGASIVLLVTAARDY